MRLGLSALALTVIVPSVIVPSVVAQPVLRAPQAEPHPVRSETHRVPLAGVDEDALRRLRERGGPKARTLAARDDLAVLTDPRSVESFELLGVTWKPSGRPAPEIRVRTRGERGGWSAWTELEVDRAHGPDPGTAGGDVRAGTAPLYVGPADGVQVAVRTDGDLPPGLRADLVDPGESAADAAVTSPGPAAAHAAVEQPGMLTRAEWGADESIRDGFDGYSDTIVAGVVHHTAHGSSDYAPEDSPGIVRAIYKYHVDTRGWSDIGYNFLVDQYGQIFEGRWGGIDKPVIGTHASGHNPRTFGVAVLGNFENVQPTDAAENAVEEVAAYKLGMYYRDPEGTVEYDGHQIDVLSGHRDIDSTLCPGEHLHGRMAEIRSGTDARIGTDATPARPAAGDFDGDGYDDVVMRAPGEGLKGRPRAGLLTVVPGSRTGPDPSRADGWNQFSSGVTGAPERGDGFASSTAAGDFDGDGYDDLAVGVPYEILGPRTGVDTGHGAVHVFYGSATGLRAAGDQWLTIADAGNAEDDGDAFGTALATGDVRGDGSDDLVVGAPGAGPSDDGSVVTYRGSASGVVASSAREFAPGMGLPADPAGGGDADRFGMALAIGDLDTDGRGDLVVGAPAADLSGVTDAGAVSVVPGGTGGLQTASAEGYTQGTAGVPGRPERGDEFGRTVATGQLDGRLGADAAIGAPGDGVRGSTAAGMINVLYAGSAGLTGADAEGRSQRSPGVGGIPQPRDRFGGRALAAADFDADGLDDLAVSVGGEDLGADTDAGAVAVFSGTPNGLGGDEFWAQGKAGVPGRNETGDRFGSSVAAGASNRGARADLVIGVAGENRDRGGVRVLRGRPSLLGSHGAVAVGQQTTGVPGRAEPGDRAGS